MPVLKIPTIPAIAPRPPRQPGQSMEQRIKELEDYSDRVNSWAISLNRSLTAYTKQLDDLFNRGSVKRLES